MARLTINIPCEDGTGALNIYVENSEIVFSMEPYDPEENPCIGGLARIPVDQFRDMLDKLLYVKPVQ